MDKNAIKKYAVWAREELIEKVTARAVKYDVVKDKELNPSLDSINGEVLSESEKNERKALIKKINEDGYDQVMEEVAYTWFNRFIAIRFMEVNGYLPSHIRVFSNENGEFRPQILSEAIHLEMPGLDMEKVLAYKEDSNEDELFKYFLKVQCNALNEILPQMFQKLEDYTELLLPDYLLREGSVIETLVNDIPEDNFDISSDNGQIEIIGWMYQYYISAKHDEVVDPLHGKVVKKDEVPAATQLFTTDWVVRYLIDNSVGRYWIERNPESQLAKELTYFVTPKDGQIKYVDEKITPQDVTVFDPCVGSGHFLVYAFEVLMKIYVEYGFSESDAASEIVKNNIFGLDIDGRATQLAYFAVMMKARQYDRRFFTRGIQPQIYEIMESNNADKSSIDYFCGNDIALRNDVEVLLDTLKDAKEYGSILQMPDVDFGRITERFGELEGEVNLYNPYLFGEFRAFINEAELLSKKYAVVATNPPYLNKFDSNLKNYINTYFRSYSGDLFSVFIYRNFGFCKKNGYSALMTPNVWMFTISYEDLRKYVISNGITSLVQLAKGSFFKEATVDICAFVLSNKKESLGTYYRLENFNNTMEDQGIALQEGIRMEVCAYRYDKHSETFLDIPGTPFAYWASDASLAAFDNGILMEQVAKPRQGLKTGDNNRFVRMWYEISKNKFSIYSGNKWYPYNKGGAYRRWYGNNDNVINWENDGHEIKNFYGDNGKLRSRPQNLQFMGKEGLTYTDISSSYFGIRWSPEGFLFDATGSMIFTEQKWLFYILGILSSKVTNLYTSFFSATVHFEVGEISRIPIILNEEYRKPIERIVKENIDIARSDWNAFETSWEYQKNPLMNKQCKKIADAYEAWSMECEERRKKLKAGEEELNKLVIDIYHVGDELDKAITDDDLTLYTASKKNDVKLLISYAVGCMFGRYSLDKDGLIYAGGEWNDNDYITYQPDKDAIIPICDDEYFADDIVKRFVAFISVAYGMETLEENLQFIADALDGNGTAREVIRNYFINDFYADHLKMYQKRPIYWLFDSGKKNGFKCLIYMHRYQPDTIARIRTDYVHEQQARYRTAIEEIENRIASAAGSDKVKLTKKLNTLKAQDDEIHAYEEKIHHLADQMISIDLDDGVKHNYEIFKDVLAKIK